jgi:hypothetical protein
MFDYTDPYSMYTLEELMGHDMSVEDIMNLQESDVMHDSELAYLYTLHKLGHPWYYLITDDMVDTDPPFEAEYAIATAALYAYQYARDVLKEYIVYYGFYTKEYIIYICQDG